MSERFSRRHGLSGDVQEITVRNDAPENLRFAVVQIAYDSGFRPQTLRSVVCKTLMVPPDDYNWTEFPNVDEEVRRLLRDCEWYRVYDVIEEIHAESQSRVSKLGVNGAENFANELNSYLREQGIGWQLTNGQVEVRGTEPFEYSLDKAVVTLQEKGRETSPDELRKAIKCLSQRPEPDESGAIQHAMAALEIVARDVIDDTRPTLGAILKKYPDLLPKPLDQAIEKAWGYASETGRHMKEGNPPDYEEAELIVGISSAVCFYLTHKLKEVSQPDPVLW